MRKYRRFVVFWAVTTLLGGCGYADLTGASQGQSDDGEATAAVAAAPKVVALQPVHGSQDVSVNTTFTAIFDVPVTAKAESIRVTVDGDAIDASMHASGSTLTLTPAGPLPYASAVSVWIDPGAVTGPQDVAFEGLLVASDWRVTTEPNPDNTAPTVNWDHPQATPSAEAFVLKTDIPSALPLRSEPIPLIFSEPVVVLDENRIVLEVDSGKGIGFASIPATVTVGADDRVTIEPTNGGFSSLADVIYRLSLLPGAVADEAGNGLAPDVRYFRFYENLILPPPSV